MFRVRDTHTTCLYDGPTYATRKAANRAADKLNLGYGAHRYAVEPTQQPDKLRDQERPTVLGYELDRRTLTPLRKYL